MQKPCFYLGPIAFSLVLGRDSLPGFIEIIGFLVAMGPPETTLPLRPQRRFNDPTVQKLKLAAGMGSMNMFK